MPKQQIYQLKISLASIFPEIWRRILVPGDIALDALHMLIQITMGWENCHLHQFVVGETTYSAPEFELEQDDVRDEYKVRLNEVAPKAKDAFSYEYDFGDGWRHMIIVENMSDSFKDYPDHPVCTDGTRACPPEDVGGTSGYEDFLLAINDSQHENHEEMLDWIGGEFDPEHFDLKSINKNIKKYLKITTR